MDGVGWAWAQGLPATAVLWSAGLAWFAVCAAVLVRVDVRVGVLRTSGRDVVDAAEHHGVRALGVTLSRNQAEWAQREIERRAPLVGLRLLQLQNSLGAGAMGKGPSQVRPSRNSSVSCTSGQPPSCCSATASTAAANSLRSHVKCGSR